MKKGENKKIFNSVCAKTIVVPNASNSKLIIGISFISPLRIINLILILKFKFKAVAIASNY